MFGSPEGSSPRCLRRKCIPNFAVTLLVVLALSTSAHALVVTYKTPNGASTGGQAVAAQATFNTSANQITILLENLQADPRSVMQCLNGIEFHVANGLSVGSLTNSSGNERLVALNGTYSAGRAPTATGWALSTVTSDFVISLLGTHTAPDHMLIGPPAGSNVYANANSSIRRGSHNPFLALSATFTLNVPGVTSDTDITAATFMFNTSSGFTVTGGNGVPEPASCLLLFVPALLIRRRGAAC